MSVFASLVADAFRLGLSGKEVDLVVRSAAPNVKDSLPFVTVRLGTLNEFVSMLRDAQHRFIYVENGRSWFSALYVAEHRCPWPRMYILEDMDNPSDAMKLRDELHQHGYDLERADSVALARMLDQAGHAERVRAYRTLLEQETKGYVELHQGRSHAGIVSESIVLNSSGNCLACGSPAQRSMTATLAGSDGLMVGFSLCEPCYNEAITYPSLLTYLADKTGMPFHHPVRTMSQQEVFDIGTRVLQNELGCEIIKTIPEKFQVTGRRSSGYQVTFRLTGLLNYAYNVFDPSHTQVGRFDSSNDHPDLPVQPDHFHFGLPADNSKVRSSFLTGIPEVDARAIREFLESIGA